MKVKCEVCGKKTKPYAGINLDIQGIKYNVGVTMTAKDHHEVVLCKNCLNNILIKAVFLFWKDCGQPIIVENKEERNG